MSKTSSIPSVIAFEGVDGAGKSTVIARVADALTRAGQRIHLPRSGKEHDSRPTRMIRRLTRDPRNLSLCSTSEFLLYCAREVQILEEEVQPALARDEVVLLDRSLLTPEVMATFGRGLRKSQVQGVLDALGENLAPAFTMIFEVHPRTSRIRKRIAKIREQGPRDPGRKGLSGSAFKERVRAGYIEKASSEGWPRFCVERMTPDELAEQVLRCIRGQKVTRNGQGEPPRWMVDPQLSLEEALDELESQDPAMALYFSRGLIAGRERRARWLEKESELVAWSLDPQDPLLPAALECRPEIVLAHQAYRPWTGEQDLRAQWASKYPRAALLGLEGVHGEQADALRESLLEQCPGAVVESLSGREDSRAQSLRNRGWKQADVFERAASLVGCIREKNQRRRNKLLKLWPHLAVSSLRGVPAELADPVLRESMQSCPKAVLKALIGREDAASYKMRRELVHVGREAIDAIRGLDGPQSWAMREEHIERWPSTVAWSLWGLEGNDARARMLHRCSELAPGDLHMMRRKRLFDEAAHLPEWAWPRRNDSLRGDAL